MHGVNATPSNEQSIEFYRKMYLIRRFEETCNELYLQGRIPSTLHLYIGQESVAVGVCGNLSQEDYLLSTHRPHGHALAKGVTPHAIMAELFGKATGTCKGKGGSMHVGDINVGMPPAVAIVGGSVPIAAGMALAAKMSKNQRVSASFFGDGATNEGAWHESLNIASIWKLPVIFVCENNLYAASTPYAKAFNVSNVADRACAYGIPGVIVDGNDVVAVYQAAQQAVERARNGDGPTLLECKTYRQCGHSRSDPRTYRSKDEEAEWNKRDPLIIHEKWLADHKVLDTDGIKKIQSEVEAYIQEAIKFADESPYPVVEDVYTDVFTEEGVSHA